MSQNGLLTDVRWEWTGTELTANLVAGTTVLPVLDPESITAGEFVWVASTGPYEITEADPDAATFTVTPGLSLDVDGGTEVARDIGGKPGQVWVAEVILPDAAKPIEVPLTIHDLSVMPEGTYDPPVAIILSDDLQRVENLPGSLPVVSGEYIPVDSLPPAEPPADAPPAASPVPTVESGPSAVIVRFTAPLDADTYDLYHTYDPAAPVSAGNLLMENVTSPVWIYFDRNRVPLSLIADSYFAIVARNGVEDAAPSAWVAGRPGQVQPGYQTQLMGDVIATRLSGQTVEGATLKGGVLDILGALYATNGYLDITANQMQALAATFKDNLTIQGLKNKLGGDFEIGTGVTAPTTKVSVSAGPWTTKTMPSAIKPCWQMCDSPDGLSHLAVTNQELGVTNSTVYVIRKSDGVVTGSFLLGSMPYSTKTPVSMCRIGNTLYVLVTDATDASDANAYWIYSYDISSLSGTRARVNSQRLFNSQANRVALGVYNGELIVAWINANLNLRLRTYSPTFPLVLNADNTSAFVYGARADVLAVGQQGTPNVFLWVNGYQPGGGYNLSMSTADSADNFPLPSGTFYGLYFDGTRMHALTTTKVHSGSKHPGGSYDYQWTQVDNDTTAGSTTAESTPSAILTSSAVPRWQFPIITTPPPDDDGTTNGANTVGVYAAPTGFSGGPRKQFAAPTPPAPASYPDGTLSASFDQIITSGGAAVVPPTINGFLDSAHVATNQPGRIWSLPTDTGGGRLVEVKGDGITPRIRNLRFIKPVRRSHRDTTQSVGVSAFEVLNFPTLDKAEGITVTSNGRTTIVRAGEYVISGQTHWDNIGLEKRKVTEIRVNGVAIARCDNVLPTTGASAGNSQPWSKQWYLNVGDYVEIWVWQNHTANVNIMGPSGTALQTWLDIQHVSD